MVNWTSDGVGIGSFGFGVKAAMNAALRNLDKTTTSNEFDLNREIIDLMGILPIPRPGPEPSTHSSDRQLKLSLGDEGNDAKANVVNSLLILMISMSNDPFGPLA